MTATANHKPKHWFTNQDVAAQRHSCISISELYDLWLNDIHRKARFGGKLQALVYDILPPATAVTDYAIALKKKKKKKKKKRRFFVWCSNDNTFIKTTRTK